MTTTPRDPLADAVGDYVAAQYHDEYSPEPPDDEDAHQVDPEVDRAERLVLGAAMGHDPDAPTTVLAGLHAGDYADPRHGVVHQALAELTDAGQPTDFVTTAQHMRATATMPPGWGIGSLEGMHADAVMLATKVALTGYVHVVRTAAQKRALRADATALAQAVTGPTGSVLRAQAVLDRATDRAARYATTSSDEHTLDALVDHVVGAMEAGPDTDPGITYGWPDVDEILVPMRPGKLIVVGALNGAGKSVMLANMAANIAIRQGKRVLVHTLEMSGGEYAQRILAAEARVNLDVVTRKPGAPVTEWDWRNIAEAQSRLAGASMTIVDGAEKGLADIRASIRKHRPDVAFVDYLQLMTAPVGKGDRRTALDELTRGLKTMAAAEGVVVVVAVQLNRGPHARADKRPTIADIRESGGAGNDADVVLFIHREEMFNAESTRAGEVDVIVEKQRNGPSGRTVALASLMRYQRFADLASRA